LPRSPPREAAVPDMPADHDAYAALRHRDYRLLLAGGVVSAVGLEVGAAAVGWELYRRTDSAWSLGLAGLAQFLPVLLPPLPPPRPPGRPADRHRRRPLSRLARALQVLAPLGLPPLPLPRGPAPLAFLSLLLLGVGRAFNAPARPALLAQVVPAETLANAVT